MTAERRPFEIAKIDASGRLRALDQAWVATLAEDFLAAGQLLPIEIELTGEDTARLIFGGHRLAAAVLREWTHIDAVVWPAGTFADEAERRLREIKENFIRRELTVLDRALNLAAWKDIYEAQNPVAGRGGKRVKRETEVKLPDLAVCFSEVAAGTLDISERSIFRAVQIARGLSAQTVEAISSHALANHQQSLLQLAVESPARQARILSLLLAEGDTGVASVADAIAAIDKLPAPQKQEPWSRLAGTFARLPQRQQFSFFDTHAEAIEAWLAQRGVA